MPVERGQYANRICSAITNSSINHSLHGRSAAELENHPPDRLGKRAIHRASAGAFVTSSAKTLRHAGHINFAFAAKADPAASVGKLAQECRHLDVTDRQNVIHQSFAVLFDRPASFHLLLRDPYVANVALEMKVAQRFPE